MRQIPKQQQYYNNQPIVESSGFVIFFIVTGISWLVEWILFGAKLCYGDSSRLEDETGGKLARLVLAWPGKQPPEPRLS